MLQFCRELDLALESLGPDGRGKVRVQDFERDVAIMLGVEGEIDSGHAAPAELPFDAVFASKTLAKAFERVGHSRPR